MSHIRWRILEEEEVVQEVMKRRKVVTHCWEEAQFTVKFFFFFVSRFPPDQADSGARLAHGFRPRFWTCGSVGRDEKVLQGFTD